MTLKLQDTVIMPVLIGCMDISHAWLVLRLYFGSLVNFHDISTFESRILSLRSSLAPIWSKRTAQRDTCVVVLASSLVCSLRTHAPLSTNVCMRDLFITAHILVAEFPRYFVRACLRARDSQCASHWCQIQSMISIWDWASREHTEHNLVAHIHWRQEMHPL